MSCLLNERYQNVYLLLWETSTRKFLLYDKQATDRGNGLGPKTSDSSHQGNLGGSTASAEGWPGPHIYKRDALYCPTPSVGQNTVPRYFFQLQ